MSEEEAGGEEEEEVKRQHGEAHDGLVMNVCV